MGRDSSPKCPFCSIPLDAVISANNLVFTIRDAFPVTEGHTLVIPRRHFCSYFEATDEEHKAILEAIREVKDQLDAEFHPDGYNIGVNVGEVAGQTVDHLHVHVIPRYEGDPRPEGKRPGPASQRVVRPLGGTARHVP